MSNIPDFSYINKNGKWVHGPAAFLHYVYSVMGGIPEYNDEVGEKYIKNFINLISEAANDDIAKAAKKKQFKKVI